MRGAEGGRGGLWGDLRAFHTSTVHENTVKGSLDEAGLTWTPEEKFGFLVKFDRLDLPLAQFNIYFFNNHLLNNMKQILRSMKKARVYR